jgi:hypothetical protein
VVNNKNETIVYQTEKSFNDILFSTAIVMVLVTVYVVAAPSLQMILTPEEMGSNSIRN